MTRSFKKTKNLFIFIFLLSAIVGCSTIPETVRDLDETKAYDKVTLVVPLEVNHKKVYLIDNAKKVVKNWKVEHFPVHAQLHESGNLYVASTEKNYRYPGYGIREYLEILSPTNKVLWRYRNRYMHHDFEVLPDGKIAIIAFYPVDPKVLSPEATKGKKLFEGKLWFDEIKIIDPLSKKAIWSWRSHKYIKESEIEYMDRAGDAIHMNSIRYIEKNPLNGKPAFMVSMRHTNSVVILEFESGKVLWKSPKGLFEVQHDARFLKNGNILVFNNSFKNSKVQEINIKTNEVVWNYEGGAGSGPIGNYQFSSTVMSGAQRLPNGNTLITLSLAGLISEVTKDGETVWEFFNNIVKKNSNSGFPVPALFKAQAYDKSILEKLY